jgi:hypothetical protein
MTCLHPSAFRGVAPGEPPGTTPGRDWRNGGRLTGNVPGSNAVTMEVRQTAKSYKKSQPSRTSWSSGLQATPRTRLWRPVEVPTRSFSPGSRMTQAPPRPPVASRLPSGEKARPAVGDGVVLLPDEGDLAPSHVPPGAVVVVARGGDHAGQQASACGHHLPRPVFDFFPLEDQRSLSGLAAPCRVCSGPSWPNLDSSGGPYQEIA